MLNEKRYAYIILALLTISTFWGFQPKVTPNVDNSFEEDTIKANALIDEADELTNEAKYELAVDKIETANNIYRKYKLWELVVEYTNTQAGLADEIGIDTKKKYATQSLSLGKKFLNENHYQSMKITLTPTEKHSNSLKITPTH